MAEFCKNCFIKINNVDKDQESKIILSNVKDFCERCGAYDYFVRYFDDPNNKLFCQKDRITICNNAYTNNCHNCDKCYKV